MDKLVFTSQYNMNTDVMKAFKKIDEIVDWINRQEEKWDDANEALKEFKKGISKL